MNNSVEEIIEDFRQADRPDLTDEMYATITVGEMRTLIKYFDDIDSFKNSL